jgi:hypothetical protein
VTSLPTAACRIASASVAVGRDPLLAVALPAKTAWAFRFRRVSCAGGRGRCKVWTPQRGGEIRRDPCHYGPDEADVLRILAALWLASYLALVPFAIVFAVLVQVAGAGPAVSHAVTWAYFGLGMWAIWSALRPRRIRHKESPEG